MPQPVAWGWKPSPVVAPVTHVAPAPVPTSSGGGTSAETAAAAVAPAQGIVALAWYATPAAGASDSALLRAGHGIALPIVLPFRGSIVGMSLAWDTAMTAGTASFVCRVNGSETDARIFGAVTYPRGYLPFSGSANPVVRDDYLDVAVTTNAEYLPITAKVEVVVFIALDQSEA